MRLPGSCLPTWLMLGCVGFSPLAAEQGHVIRFDAPAERWLDALPVGNGHWGAMVFGGTVVERVQLNEDSVWAGPPVPENADNLGPKLAEIRQLFFDGKPAEGEARVSREILGPRISPRSYQTLGDLRLRHPGSPTNSELRLEAWWRSRPNATLELGFHQVGSSEEDWTAVVTTQDLEIAPATTVLFRAEFEVTREELELADGKARLQLSPIDDQSTVYLNGVILGRTRDYGRAYEFTLENLRVGTNVVLASVTNVGGPGHFAQTANLQIPAPIPDLYNRMLDLQTGVATTEYSIGDNRFRREVFASAPDDVLVVRVESQSPGGLNLAVDLDRPADFNTRAISVDRLVMRGRAQHGGEHLGTHWLTALRALPEGGRIRAEGQSLVVEAADALTLLLSAKTDYHFDNPSHPLQIDLEQACLDRLAGAVRLPYAELKHRSVADHQALFDRCVVDLGDTAADLAAQPTPARLEALRQGAEDPDLIETYFQYGRYLLMGSSRPGSLPANLQGLWNDSLEAPWNADYHININIQMNYWPAEVTGLPELTEPLFRLITGLRRDGSELARKLGCEGFAASHTTDAWQWAALIGSPGYGMWPLGAAWSTAHVMEHYRFTGDTRFLREIGYPLLEGSAAFLLDWLVTDPNTGKLVSGPTTSPENSYRFEGQRLTLSMGNSMDQMIVWENFSNLLQAAAALEIDDAFTARVRTALENLALPRMGSDGRILEWAEEYEEAEPGHRHISHLYGLHPGYQFTPWDTPDFAQAARRVLEARLARGGGHTGWSRAWIINFYARLLDGEAAYQNLLALLTQSTLPNLFDTHPPFQIDGNFGGCAGIAEMLLQSHARDQALHLLPALPSAWPKGEVRGLRARGGFIVDMTWSESVLTAVAVRSTLGNRCRIACGEVSADIETRAGHTYLFDGALRSR